MLTTPPVALAARPRRFVITLAIGLVTASLFLGLGYAGVAPWSTALPGYHASGSSTSVGISFGTARGLADPVAAGTTGGSWSLVTASGIATPVGFTIPPPPSGNATPYPSPCPYGTTGSGPSSSIIIPAYSGYVGAGLAPAWLFEYTSATPAILIVTVLNGQASVYGEISAGGCGYGFGYGGIQPIGSHVVDSTIVASAANAWGGSAFLANVTSAAGLYSISGGMTFPVVYNGPPINGTNGTPPPPYPIPVNYTIPASWQVSYTSCLPWSPAGMTKAGSFFASLDATNGTLRSVSAYLWDQACYGGPISSGPPGAVSMPPPMGIGGSSMVLSHFAAVLSAARSGA